MAGPSEGIIRRKLAASRAEAQAGGPGADRGWRLALARAARDKLHISLDFHSLTLDRRSLGEVVELVPEQALIAVLDGPAEGLGVLLLSREILAGMIEAQTIGRIKSGDVAPRKPTRTDAAMVAGVIDTALRGLEQTLAEEADLTWAGGFRYASFLDEPRPLGLLLEDTTYRVLRAQVGLADGARVGEVILALPAEGRGQGPGEKTSQSQGPDHTHMFLQALAERVNGAQSGLDAVLGRLRMPLAEVMALDVGAVLALPDAGLDRISLEGMDGRHVALCKLGQNRGLRAVRLSDESEVTGSLSEPGLAEGEAFPEGFGGAVPAAPQDEGFGDFAMAPAMDFDFAATGTE